ncbi:MAG: hypothetical protein M3P11_00520 [Actinomycetota bacterium]|nr:hypothetical protein [Actinomycetota bacterium]
MSPTAAGNLVTPGPTPPQIAAVEHDVEKVRGFTYERPVAVEAITQTEMAARLRASSRESLPASFLRRRSTAWQTIGVIPPDADLRAVLLKFQTGQIAGYYDPNTGELVYVGTTQLNVMDEFVLAHELTHAIDDQHFNLRRLNKLNASCRDDDQQAALGAIEGSAQYFATQVLLRFPGALAPDGGSSGGSLEGIPPFVTTLELWPYTAGQAFITAREADGGLRSVNDAIRHLPVSTEQVMHAERYPSDRPQPVDIPDLGPALGAGWHDLDVQQVGEEWLKAMLALRLDDDVAATAAAGWGGGIYRAWTDGKHAAVLMRTTWDTPADATEFGAAVDDWLSKGSTPSFVGRPDEFTVEIGFGSDSETEAKLEEAA